MIVSMKKNQYDYVVIGSGSAGGMIGFRLSEDKSIRVLVLEAGSAKMHWSQTS